MIPKYLIIMQTGIALNEISTIGFQAHHFVGLILLGVLALIPTFLAKKYMPLNSETKSSQ